MKFNKKNFLTLLLTLTIFTAFSQIVNDSQLLKSTHWVCRDLSILSTEAKKATFLDITPISVGEIKFYLSQFNYETLSESGKTLYDNIYNFLYGTKYSQKTKDQPASTISANIKATPELYLNTNKEIATDIIYNYQDWPLSLPLIFAIGNNITLEMDMFLGKNYYAAKETDSFTNIPLSGGDIEYQFPRYAYGNIGQYFDKWGFNATVGKEGFTIGNTKLGSIIYNSTFETDAYSVLSAYSEGFKYNMIFSQVTHDKFLYLHNFNFRILPNLKLGLTEGGCKKGPIELCFFDPTMIIHSYYLENNYERNNPLKKYDLGFSYCAYLGINLDYYPVENLRLYLLWAQTEFQLPSELTSNYGKMLPDGYGIQTGFDLVIPSQQKGYYTGNLEVLYTAPYLYVEQSPDWSLINFRFDKMNQHTDVASWIGTPYGPDTFALTTSFGYKQPEKWSANMEYLLSMKGCINADTLLEKAQSKKDPADPTLYPSYYPSVSEKLGLEDTEDAIKRSRASGLTGTIQYKNNISLSGEYYITKKLIATAKGTYVFVFNNNHEKNNFQQGLQLKLSLTYNIF